MNALENELDYPLGDVLPAPGERLQVASGVFWIRMPLPFALDHINLWLVRDNFRGREGWTLIDCGVSTEETKKLWTKLFASGLDGLPIVRIVCTHMHPDHLGLADWIAPQFNAPLWMTLGEYTMGRNQTFNAGLNVDVAVEHFRIHGVDNTMLDSIRQRNSNYFTSLVPAVPTSFHRIRADLPVQIGDRSYKVFIGTGHSPEHASLYNDKDGLLFAGDMVLPRISTNVAVWEIEPESNPVQWFIDSLAQYQECRDDTLVLPSHGRPFRKFKRRIEQLNEHHAERLEMVLAACKKTPQHATDILPVMFSRKFDVHHTTFAICEALAHLHALWYRGQLTRQIDGSGVVRFAAV